MNQAIQEESDWFFKVSWNLALQAVETGHYELAFKYYNYCSKLLDNQQQHINYKSQKPMTLFLCIVAVVSSLRSDDTFKERCSIDEIMTIMSEFKEFPKEESLKQIEILHAVYEFEILCRFDRVDELQKIIKRDNFLKYPANFTEKILQVLSTCNPNSKSYEVFDLILLEYFKRQDKDYSVCANALKLLFEGNLLKGPFSSYQCIKKFQHLLVFLLFL